MNLSLAPRRTLTILSLIAALLLAVSASDASAQVGVFAGGVEGAHIDEHSSLKTQLNSPSALALAPNGSLVILDGYNHRVLAVSADRRHVEVVAGGVGLGDRLDENNPLNTQLSYPGSLVLGPDGSVYIADLGNHRVLAVSPDRRRIEVVAGGIGEGGDFDENNPLNTNINYPSALAIGCDGSLFIADHHRVLALSADRHRIEIVAGGVGRGNRLVENDPLDTQLDSVNALAPAADGSLLIADSRNHRVLALSADRRRIEVVAGGVGQGDRLDENNPLNTQLNTPLALAVTPQGSLLVGDTDNNRILIVSGQHVEVFAGGVGEGDRLDESNPLNTQLTFPSALALAPDGSWLIADTNNHRVLIVSAKDEYEVRLQGLIADGLAANEQSQRALKAEEKRLAKTALVRAVRHLRILSTANPPNPRLGNMLAGQAWGDGSTTSQKHRASLFRLGEHRKLMGDWSLLPQDLRRLIVAGYLDRHPSASFLRLRAEMALDSLQFKVLVNRLVTVPG